MLAFSSLSDAEQLGPDDEVQTDLFLHNQEWLQPSRHKRCMAQ
jgi:hypothetical protein